ncbi:ribonuclease H2 subunit B [Entomortierella parvispora]|uniref:Ribonuclease H2 subunit B n=1 Tax=Entomortierella parvispora TaxID=205924 RepID=A0A9P3H6Z8_9FUNG|nr:ribonuclease H2 subunit B [Entomortierella parvispora]
MLLPNPSSGLPSRYTIQDGKLFEMQMIDSEGLRSWFVGNTIQSDGSLFLITPIDPVFMFIPILDIVRKKTKESEGRFMTVEGIFESDQYSSLRRLTDLAKVQTYLELVCEVRNASSTDKTFRLEDEKTMAWLRKKVEILISQFASIPVLVDSIAYTESLPENIRKEAIMQSALRLVTSYLSDHWATTLSAEYSFPELEKLESRTQLPSVADFGKRAGMEFEEDGKPVKDTKKPKLSVGQRKLAKASTAGMKPLSSFFAKK